MKGESPPLELSMVPRQVLRTSEEADLRCETAPLDPKEGSLDEGVDLLLRVAGDDVQAFEALHRGYSAMVRASFNSLVFHPRVELEDLCQEVWARVWSRRLRYRPHSTSRAYLLGIAKRVALEACREMVRQQNLQNRLKEFTPSVATGVEELGYGEDLTQMLREAIGKLSEKQRWAFTAVLMQGLKPSVAAKKVGCSPALVSRWLCNARKRLVQLVPGLSRSPGDRRIAGLFGTNATGPHSD